MNTTQTLGRILTLSAALWAAPADARPSIAVLPFMPEDSSHPREGAAVAEKLLWKANGRGGSGLVSLSWAELSRLMEEAGLDRRALGRPETLREIGRLLGVRAIVTGSFRADDQALVASPVMVDVETGRQRRGASWTVERDIMVEPPPFEVAPPVLGEDELDLRDAVADSPCYGAASVIDDLERRILDLKARYWALQLAKGVHMAGIKFNPGSTITDPALKREFYERIRSWQGAEFIPELTPLELKEFAEIDEQAFKLARLCEIL